MELVNLRSEHFVVYQASNGKLGYRSLGIERTAELLCKSADMLAGAMVNCGEAVQCWCVQAENGGKAITKVRRIMKSEALSL